MSADKSDAALYLEARGWFMADEEDAFWISPHHPAHTTKGQVNMVSEEVALRDQRARDATEERIAWDRYAARLCAAVDADGEWATSNETAARLADDLLELRRARFGEQATVAAARKVTP